MIKKTWAALFTVWLLMAAGGCANTADGIGDDIENAGDEIEDELD